jgi:hypothetical protein
MKKDKFAKLGLVFMMAVMLILGTTCKKSDESAADIAVITNIAAMSMTDLNSISFSGAAQSRASSCVPFSNHVNLSNKPSYIANPSAGHGLYTGYLDSSINKNCDINITIMSQLNCILGAVTTDGHNLGGMLYLNGSAKSVNNSFDLSIREFNGTTGFEVDGRTHTIDLTCAAHGALYGGTVSITGHIDGEVINITSSY